MGELALQAVRALLAALVVWTWPAVGAHLFDLANPLRVETLFAWLLAAALLSMLLRSRPRSLAVYLLVHGLAGGAAFLHFIGHLRGVPWQGSPSAWLGALAAAHDTLAWIGTVLLGVLFSGLWLRGALSGYRKPATPALLFEFEIGLLNWVFVLLLAQAGGGDGAWLLEPLLLFVATGLLLRSWQQAGWGGVTLSAVLLVPLMLLLGAGLRAIAGDVRGPLQALLGVFGGVLEALVVGLFGGLWGRASRNIAESPPPAPSEGMQPAAGPLAGPAWVDAVFQGLFIAVIAVSALVLLVILVSLLWVLLRRQVGAQHGRQPGTSAGWRRLLRLWWRWLRLQRRRLRKRLAERIRRLRLAVAETAWPRSLRAAYRGLLRWGALAGQPRHPQETPREYAARVQPTLPPGAAAFVWRLTEAYETHRYGRQAEMSIFEIRHWRFGYWALFLPWRLLGARLRARRRALAGEK